MYCSKLLFDGDFRVQVHARAFHEHYKYRKIGVCKVSNVEEMAMGSAEEIVRNRLMRHILLHHHYR